MSLIHASCVAIAGSGVIVRGPSGAGKSDLALRLIDAGAELVADECCNIVVRDGQLVATAPANLAGKIEVRGYGIVELAFRREAVVALVVDLMPEAEIERMPKTATCVIAGVTVPRLTVDAFTASAAAKVRIVLGRTP